MSPMKRRLLGCNHGLASAAMICLLCCILLRAFPQQANGRLGPRILTLWAASHFCQQPARLRSWEAGDHGSVGVTGRWRKSSFREVDMWSIVVEEKHPPKTWQAVKPCLIGTNALCLMRCDGRWSNGRSFDFHNWLRNLGFFSELLKSSC